MAYSHVDLGDAIDLGSFGRDINAVVVGATGGIGRAFAELLARQKSVTNLSLLSRSDPGIEASKALWQPVDIEREETIAAAVQDICARVKELHVVIIATGVLHDGDALQPEKTWRTLEAGSLQKAFAINTIGPALAAKHFLPVLARRRKSVFAVLSARVGSISDNRLGGWHSYRASKAALNMLIQTLAIELKRSNQSAICVALHPGTVDSELSKPFQANVPKGKLFTPEFSASRLLSVVNDLSVEQSGKVFAWDGAEIAP